MSTPVDPTPKRIPDGTPYPPGTPVAPRTPHPSGASSPNASNQSAPERHATPTASLTQTMSAFDLRMDAQDKPDFSREHLSAALPPILPKQNAKAPKPKYYGVWMLFLLLLVSFGAIGFLGYRLYLAEQQVIYLTDFLNVTSESFDQAGDSLSVQLESTIETNTVQDSEIRKLWAAYQRLTREAKARDTQISTLETQLSETANALELLEGQYEKALFSLKSQLQATTTALETFQEKAAGQQASIDQYRQSMNAETTALNKRVKALEARPIPVAPVE